MTFSNELSLSFIVEPGRYNSLALSPAGRRVAVFPHQSRNTPNWDVWLARRRANTSTPVDLRTSPGGLPPSGSGDGSSVIFDSIRAGRG